jgi:hypothetical protein
LALSDVIADVFNPAAGDLADVGESTFILVLIQVDEHAEVGDLVNLADDKITNLRIVYNFIL